MRWFLLMAAALLAACTARPPAASPEPRAPVTILIGIDGFRADYLDRGVTSVLSQLAGEGARDDAPEMAALFVADSPAFVGGVTLPAFDNIHVPPLLRQLAGAPQATDVDGEASVLGHALAR